MIKCRLCNRDFGVIQASHLRAAHGITPSDYLKEFPDAALWSVESKLRLSESTSAAMTDELRLRISEATAKGMTPRGKQRLSQRVIGEEWRRKISESLSGRHPSEETRKLMSESITRALSNPSVRQTLSEKSRAYWTKERRQQMSAKISATKPDEVRRSTSEALTGRPKGEEARRKQSETQKRNWKDPEYRLRVTETNRENWKDPEFASRMVENWNRKPNLSELQLQSILDKHFPGEWEYVGNGRVWFEGRNPDFLNVNSRKQVIEMFGMYWHDPRLFSNRPTEEGLVAHYKKYGIDCLVFWECDIWDEDEVVRQVAEMGR